MQRAIASSAQPNHDGPSSENNKSEAMKINSITQKPPNKQTNKTATHYESWKSTRLSVPVQGPRLWTGSGSPDGVDGVCGTRYQNKCPNKPLTTERTRDQQTKRLNNPTGQTKTLPIKKLVEQKRLNTTKEAFRHVSNESRALQASIRCRR